MPPDHEAREETDAPNPGPFIVQHACAECHGTACIGELPCPACHGTGVGRFFHGTKAALAPGDFLVPDRSPNFGERGRSAGFVYLTGTLDAATWGAELALGDAPGRIYVVEPTGPIEDDPNLTNTRFPGNPSRSYRSRAPLRIIREVRDWLGHSAEALAQMREHLDRLDHEDSKPDD